MNKNVSLKSVWQDPDLNQLTLSDIILQNKNYLNKCGKFYIGTDSMYVNGKCTFAVVIAFHNDKLKVAKYYYQKLTNRGKLFNDIKVKLLKEIDLSIEAAQQVQTMVENAIIEVHADIGINKSNYSSRLHKTIRQWVKNLGYTFKVKPDSWASSSIADWHTK